MRGTRLSGRFGMGGISEERDGFRLTATEENAGEPGITGTIVHPDHQGGYRTRYADDYRGNGEVNRLELAKTVKEKSLAIYNFARKQAMTKGIIIADTKFEFGLEGDKLIVIDEMLTPDSSRFWDAKLYKPGQSQPSYDKQPVRDWLTRSGWNKEPPAPMLPQEVIESTSRIYRTAYERLTGRS